MFGISKRLANLERRVADLEYKAWPRVSPLSMFGDLSKAREQRLSMAKSEFADEILRLHDCCAACPMDAAATTFGQKVKDAIQQYRQRTQFI